jgi:hypothetical protein
MKSERSRQLGRPHQSGSEELGFFTRADQGGLQEYLRVTLAALRRLEYRSSHGAAV